MYLSRASCCPNYSQQSIWALPRWYHDGRSRRTCGSSLGRDQNPEVKLCLSIASCCPNASQQSIWASQGRAAEGGITMVVRVVLVGNPWVGIKILR